MHHVKTDHGSSDKSAENIAEYARSVNESSYYENFDCELCAQTFENEKDLRDHKIIHEEVSYEKKRAKHNFSNIQTDEWGNIIDSDSEEEYDPIDSEGSSEYDEGSEDEVDEETCKCTKCPSKFRLEQSLENHIKKVHTGAFKCRLCTWKYINEQMLKNHEDTGHSEHEWRKMNTRNSEKSNAEEVVEDDDTETFGNEKPKCSICKKEFQQISNLSRHMKNQHQPEPELEIATKKRKQDQHVVEYNKKAKTSHTCTECGKQCRDNYNLARHLKTHK